MKCWQDAEQLELFTHCWWEGIGTVALENNLSNKVNLSMIYVQAIPCLGLRSIRRTEGLAGGVRPERKVGLSGLLSREEQRRGLGGQEREMNLG